MGNLVKAGLTGLAALVLFSNVSCTTVERRTEPETPAIQTYKTTRENKAEVYRSYLEKRIGITKNELEWHNTRFEMGTENLRDTLPAKRDLLYYETSLEALNSGDEGVYKRVLIDTAFTNGIPSGIELKTLKKYLDERYRAAKQDYTEIKRKIDIGAESSGEIFGAERIITDLEFMYNSFGLPIPE